MKQVDKHKYLVNCEGFQFTVTDLYNGNTNGRHSFNTTTVPVSQVFFINLTKMPKHLILLNKKFID